MKQAETTQWSVSLDMKCPYCEKTFDYLYSDDFAEGGYESIGNPYTEHDAFKVVCEKCREQFQIKIESGL